MEYELNDSGTRATFEGGGQRDAQEGKGRMDLLPADALLYVSQRALQNDFTKLYPNALFSLARLFEKGAAKYAARNWEKGIPVSRYLDSGIRHAYKHIRCDRDEDHLTAFCWNMICGLATRLRVDQGVLSEDFSDIEGIQPRTVDDAADALGVGLFESFEPNRPGIVYFNKAIEDAFRFLRGPANIHLVTAFGYGMYALEHRELYLQKLESTKDIVSKLYP